MPITGAPGHATPQVSELGEAAGTEAAAALAGLAALTFPLACPPGSDPQDIEAFIAGHLTADHFADHMAAADRTVLCARDEDGTPVGYCLLVHGAEPVFSGPGSLRYRPTVGLDKFYIHPDHHGRGVSARLMTAALGAGRRTGARGIWLGVNQQNARAGRFYAKSGFSRVGVRTFRMGSRTEHDFILERAL
ncbi:MAG: GNAT family N-acetyltransferase [Micrococcus sp.]|nr:GNAT family N-acetyltransferase [Micrococcus sp.]